MDALEHLEHAPERGMMAVYEHRDALIARAQAVADNNAGTVVIACSSRQRSEVLAAYFSQRYGADAVMLVNSLYTTEAPA